MGLQGVEGIKCRLIIIMMFVMISYDDDDHSPHGDDRHGHDHDSHNADDAGDAYKEDEMEG